MIRRAADGKVEVRERMRGGEGTVTIRHFFAKEEFAAPVRLCARMTLPPGASIGPHQHATEDEVYIVERGTGLLDDGRTRERLNPGDAILTGRGESHSVLNDGTEPLEITAVIALYPA